MNKIILGDCLEKLAELPDNSVDLICTDPPYYKVKAEWWDNQWDKPEGFLKWLDRIAEQWQRILKPNGSLYCFASPKMSARVEVKLGDRFNVLNNITWVQPDGSGAEKGARAGMTRKYIHQSERIIFAESSVQGLTAIADRIKSARTKAGMASQKVSAIARGKETGLCWLWENPNEPGGCIPTMEDYIKVLSVLEGADCKDLKQQYEELRRPFNMSADVPYTDVWSFPTVSTYPGKHPCEKPMQMLEHIIRASSKPDAVVLDCFAGSGNTLIAAKQLGRQFIGIEIDPHWVNIINQKLGNFNAHKPTLEERVQWLETQVKANTKRLAKVEKKQVEQLSLFA